MGGENNNNSTYFGFAAVEPEPKLLFFRLRASAPALQNNFVSTVPQISFAEPPLFWAAPAPDGQVPGADSGSDLLGSAPALNVMFDTRTRLFCFACLKDAAGAGAALRSAALAPALTAKKSAPATEPP